MDTSIDPFQLFVQAAGEDTVVYHKYCRAGDTISFGNWVVIVYNNRETSSYEGSQIRNTLVPYRDKNGNINKGDLRQGLRFCFDLPDVGETIQFEGADYTVKKHGALVVLDDYLPDPNMMTVSQVNVLQGLLSQSPLIDVTVGEKTYKSVYIYNITEAAKDTVILARAYLECEDTVGDIKYIYTTIQANSLTAVYQKIQAANQTGSMDPAVRAWWE